MLRSASSESKKLPKYLVVYSLIRIFVPRKRKRTIYETEIDSDDALDLHERSGLAWFWGYALHLYGVQWASTDKIS